MQDAATAQPRRGALYVGMSKRIPSMAELIQQALYPHGGHKAEYLPDFDVRPMTDAELVGKAKAINRPVLRRLVRG